MIVDMFILKNNNLRSPRVSPSHPRLVRDNLKQGFVYTIKIRNIQ